FVTPSNHRVHHGRNSIYVDKNYGGVFILWDRLFGSFQEELDTEPVAFGLRKPLNSWNPLWANIHVYWRLLQDSVNAPGLVNKLLLPFKPPGWLPEGMQTKCQGRRVEDLYSKFDPSVSPVESWYTLGQFIVTVGLSLYVLVNSSALGYSLTTLAVGYLALSLYVHGLWLENRASALFAESFRLAILAGSFLALSFPAPQSALALLYAVFSAVIAFSLKKRLWLDSGSTQGSTQSSTQNSL
ncbi:MAG: hypothetical protein MI746_01100, partial [Pseudomonadales bacterium]|nr:hypothetical protein [Pseudomonadales bacterium]